MNEMISKLATMFGLMQSFNVMNLTKEHTLKLLQLIATTEMGKVLLQLASALRSDDGFGHVFLITTKENGDMAVIYWVETVDKLRPHIDALQATEKVLNSMGIKLEVDTVKNASTPELTKW